MEQLIDNVDSIILGFVQGSFGSLTATIQVLWRLMFIVFIAVYGYKVFIGGRFSASDLITHCFKIIIILVIATEWDTFFLFVYNMVTDLPADLAGQLMQSASTLYGPYAQADSSATANNALSLFFDRGMAVSAKILEGAGWTNIGQYLYAFAVWFGTIGLAGYAAMLIVLAKLAVGILLALGPVFILLLIFSNTRQLFEGWLRTLLNYAVIPIFVYTLLAFLLVLIEAPLQKLEDSNINDSLITVIGPFLLTSVVSILLLSQIMNLAASVTGGVSLSTMGLARYTTRNTMTGPGSRAASATGKWGWQKTAPTRKYVSEKFKGGRDNLRQALQKSREVR